MFRVWIKNSSLASIIFKLLIIIYLLTLGFYHTTLPTVAYFTDEQTVETTLVIADEFDREASESEQVNDNQVEEKTQEEMTKGSDVDEDKSIDNDLEETDEATEVMNEEHEEEQETDEGSDLNEI